MQVDDKLAKEKLAREIEALEWLDSASFVAETIRNTDLTDCQQNMAAASREQQMGSEANVQVLTPVLGLDPSKQYHGGILGGAECSSDAKSGSIPDGHAIAPAPDQGSVRNATDELDAARYRFLKDDRRGAFVEHLSFIDAALKLMLPYAPYLTKRWPFTLGSYWCGEFEQYKESNQSVS